MLPAQLPGNGRSTSSRPWPPLTRLAKCCRARRAGGTGSRAVRGVRLPPPGPDAIYAAAGPASSPRRASCSVEAGRAAVFSGSPSAWVREAEWEQVRARQAAAKARAEAAAAQMPAVAAAPVAPVTLPAPRSIAAPAPAAADVDQQQELVLEDLTASRQRLATGDPDRPYAFRRDALSWALSIGLPCTPGGMTLVPCARRGCSNLARGQPAD